MPSFSPLAWRYLIYVACLMLGLAISSLFFNLLLVELGYAERSVRLPLIGDLPLLGLLNSLPVLVAALSSLPLWWLVSRFGPHMALISSALLQGLALAGVALAPSQTVLFAAVALGGPASVLFEVSAAPFMMRHSTPRERDALFAGSAALILASSGIGSLLGGFVPGLAVLALGLAPQSAEAYRVAFLVAATITSLASLPLLSLRSTSGATPRAAATETDPGATNLRALLQASWRAMPFLVSPLLISCGAALLIPFLSLYFRQRFAAPDTTLGLIFALIGLATGAATLLAPLLSRRLGKMGTVVITQALAVPCLILLGLAPSLGLAALVAALRAALMNMGTPLYDAFTMERSPEAVRPLVAGLVSAAASAGFILGPNLSVLIQREYGFAPLFGLTAALYASAAIANYWLFLRRGF
ncbi:MAG: MFS transporter [Oscillochloridaceae bacterium umkhey_bin13]